MRDFELRVLTRDVQNPNYDRRCKYGTEQLAAFRSGTRFIHRPRFQDGEANGRPLWSPSCAEFLLDQSSFLILRPELDVALLEASVPAQPDDIVSTYAALTGNKPSERALRDLLDILLRDGGKIVRHAVEQAIQEENAPE